MKGRRFLHLVASSKGGGAAHMHTLTTALARSGYSVTAVMPADKGNVGPDDFPQHGLRFISLQYPSRSPFQRVRELAAIIKEEAPVLVHAHGSRAAFWAYWAMRWARLSQTHLVISVHGFGTPFYRQPRRLIQLIMERRMSRRASAIIACAKAERSALATARIAPPARIFVVPYGLDLGELMDLTASDKIDARKQLGVSPDTWLVLTVCRLDRPRDFSALLNAFRAMVDALPHARLFIVGGGPLHSEVATLIAQLRLEDRVTAWGFRKDVARFYAAADTYALTSWGWEGLPISVIEAQAAGLPVVVTDAGGSREAIEPGATGLLVPCSDPEALRAQLLHLANHPDKAAMMGARGRRFADRHFSLEPAVGKIRDIYAALDRPP